MPVSDFASREPNFSLLMSILCRHLPKSSPGTVQTHGLGWVCHGAEIGLRVRKELREEQVGSTEVVVRNTCYIGML